MPGVIFQFPKATPISAGVVVPGAKVTFSQTGTSTPQNTYTDAALTVAHDNPVVADSAGVFAPIYLDSSLPDYRITLTDADDVLIYQVDDVPAGTELSLNYTVEGTAPYYLLTETDAASNNKNWRWIATSEQLLLEVGNDALDTWVSVIEIDRTANTVDLVNIKSTDIQFNDTTLRASGSFTGTLTGLTTTPTPTIAWERSGNLVVLTCNAGSQGTSNTTAFTITGIPTAIRPTTPNQWMTFVVDNSTGSLGKFSIDSSGVMTFAVGAAGSGFTASNNKGLPAGWTAIYDMS